MKMRKSANQRDDGSGNIDDVVTWREFSSELKAFRMETRLLLVVGVASLKFHLPDVATVGSMVTVVGWAGLKSLVTR